MSDEYIEEEEQGGRSPFLMAVAALVGILILSVLCIVSVILLNRAGDNGDSDPAFQTRIAENQAIAATNEAIFATRAALETIAAMPTNTPAPTNTTAPTATATPTSEPTETPVVQPPDDGGDGEATPTVDLSGTSIFGGPAGTATPIGGVAGGPGTLPTTGIGAWGALALAILFSFIVAAVRRLRTN